MKRIFGAPPKIPVSGVGSIADIPHYIERLVRSPDYGVLIIQVVDAEPFIQFSAGAGEVQMDFPLITPTQRARENQIRQFSDSHHLHVRSTFGTNGGQFIDIEFPPDSRVISEATIAAFDEIFGVRPPAQLEFRGEGLGVAA